MSVEKIASLSRETFEAFNELMLSYNRLYEEYMSLNPAKLERDRLEKLKRENIILNRQQIDDLFEYVQNGRKLIPQFSFLNRFWCWDLDSAKAFRLSCRKFVVRPEIQVVHVLRLLSLIAYVYPDGISLFWIPNRLLECHFENRSKRYDFSEIAYALNELGIDDEIAAQEYLERGEIPVDDNLKYFQRKPQLLLKQLIKTQGNSFANAKQRKTLLVILEANPEISSEILDILWQDAMGDGKTLRTEIQKILEKRPDALPKVFEALKSSKSTTRSVAAQWLGRLRNPEAVKPLRDAMQKEKADSVRIDLMKAVVACGVSLDDFLEKDSLLLEAEKGLRKAKFEESPPKSLEWFPFDKIPSVHWNDGTAVDPKILQYWLVQAVKMKTPEPNPLIAYYGQLMKRSECEALARFVLEAWIERDTRIGTEAERIAKLRNDPDMDAWFRTHPNATDEDLKIAFPYYFESKREPLNSANDSKGILGTVAAWGDATVPAVMERYVREWYGWRVHQSRAIVVALGGMEHLTAIQALLSLSRKMKTKSIREEAEKAIQNIAERNEWTLDQLADRTAPTAGLDERREIRFDLGVRKLTGRWESEPKLVLRDESGKSLKAFPGRLKSDDETLYAEAKKSFQTANKLLKTTLTQQEERLYEVMCTGRSWVFEDWLAYILRHPILGRLACGLVWGVFEDDTEIPHVIFRPLEDGSLTDVNDNPVELAATDRVCIVHSLNLLHDQLKAWGEHLKDYDVKPLFTQFGREPYRLPEENRTETKISDFFGVKIMAFNLRSAATKLGFVRGETADGGWFFDYIRPMQGLDMVAVIDFSGNGLPEENNELELYNLYFRAKHGYVFPLEKVPPVLLSEIYRAVETISLSANKK